MNVSSLELSKELYELSGWGDDLEYSWVEGHVVWVATPADGQYQCPAYDCGYLLRRLPSRVMVARYKEDSTARIEVTTDNNVRLSVSLNQDTPEDALCELAIELFKQGILKKEEADE